MATASLSSSRRMAVLTGLAAVLGLVGGGAAWVLLHLIGLLTNLALFHRWGWEVPDLANVPTGPGLVIVPVLGGLCVSLIARWSPEIRGHGIPEAMEAVLTNQSRISPRTAIAKPVSAAIAIGTGGPFGAEGPIIVTGGAIGSLIGQVVPTSPSERKILLACGAAAGMSATFGSPLAAVILAIELLLFEFSSRAFVPLVVASSLAAGVHYEVFGPGPLFQVPPHDYTGLDKLPFYALLGLVCGLLAVVINRGLFMVESGFRKLPFGEFWHPMIGAVGFGAVGLVVPRALGVGYGSINDVLSSRLAAGTVAVLCIAKLVAWWLALASGTSGGTLAPLLLISGCFGTLIGTAVDQMFPSAHISPGAFALVAMAATFGAAIGATFTAIVFLFELTRDYQIMLPLMLASVLAQLVSRALLSDTLMTEKLTRRGVHVEGDYRADVLASARVSEIMTTEVLSLRADSTVAAVKALFSTDTHGAFPVVDGSGRCIGIVARTDLLTREASDDAPITEVASIDLVTVSPDDTVMAALQRILDDGIGHLPVIADGELVGMVTRSDVFRIRQSQFDQELLQPGLALSHRSTRRSSVTSPTESLGPSPSAGTDPEGPRTRNYLVVANQTLGGPALEGAIRDRLAEGPCHFTVVVPATRRPGLFQQVVDAYAGEPDRSELLGAANAAATRLAQMLAHLRSLGAEADGEVGTDDPIRAVKHVLDGRPCDEVILSTLPAGGSQWLRLDLPHQLDRVISVPVVHVEGPASQA